MTQTQSSSVVRIIVPAPVRAYFTDRRIQGQGGFQSLARWLADRLHASHILHLSSEEYDRIHHYAFNYGIGGFQARLKELVESYSPKDTRVHGRRHRASPRTDKGLRRHLRRRRGK